MKRKAVSVISCMFIFLFAINTSVFAAQQPDTNEMYTYIKDNDTTKEFSTLSELEIYLNHDITILSSIEDSTNQITPLYVPCGNGQHGGPFTFYRADNAFVGG